MIDWLTEPFALGFMQRALVASIIVGVVCAVLGCYVVLRSMAFLGDALAHAILPGVAVAYLVGANLLAGALVAGLIVAVGISYVSRAGADREDTAIGIFFAAALALGVVLISTMRTLRRRSDPRAVRQRAGRHRHRPVDQRRAGLRGLGGHPAALQAAAGGVVRPHPGADAWVCTPTRCGRVCS